MATKHHDLVGVHKALQRALMRCGPPDLCDYLLAHEFSVEMTAIAGTSFRHLVSVLRDDAAAGGFSLSSNRFGDTAKQGEIREHLEAHSDS